MPSLKASKISSHRIYVGCGNGRWAQVIVPSVGHLHLLGAIRALVKRLKPVFPFLLDLSYVFDRRSLWFKCYGEFVIL